LDNSPAMLALEPREPALIRVLHDAEDLPFPRSEFGCVAAFLCDPFLGLNFLSEARRVLRDDGILIGTTPAFEWGSVLREALGIDRMTTRFILRNNEDIRMPSALYDANQLGTMLEHVGFKSRSISVRSHRLPKGTRTISSDIEMPARMRGVSPLELEILYTFVAR